MIKNNVWEIRERYMGISQERLATKTGIRRQAISEIERGIRTPSLETALKISYELGCTVNDLFFVSDYRKK